MALCSAEYSCKLHRLKYKSLIFDTQFLVFDTKIIVLNTKFIIFSSHRRGSLTGPHLRRDVEVQLPRPGLLEQQRYVCNRTQSQQRALTRGIPCTGNQVLERVVREARRCELTECAESIGLRNAQWCDRGVTVLARPALAHLAPEICSSIVSVYLGTQLQQSGRRRTRG